MITMEIKILNIMLWLCGLFLLKGVSSSRVWLDDHGRYQNIVVAVHPSLSNANCTELFTNLQNTISRFSSGLEELSKRHLAVGRVQVIMPHGMAQSCHMNHLPTSSWHRWSTADIRLEAGSSHLNKWSPHGSVGVGVKQVRGCTKPADFIRLSADALLNTNEEEESDHLELLGRSLLAGWTRYRWGVFEERGYKDDPKYHEVNQCQSADLTNCSETVIRPSLMQEVSVSKPLAYCDPYNHNYEAKTLHNLACSGHSVSEVLYHHPDFEILGGNIIDMSSETRNKVVEFEKSESLASQDTFQSAGVMIKDQNDPKSVSIVEEKLYEQNYELNATEKLKNVTRSKRSTMSIEQSNATETVNSDLKLNATKVLDNSTILQANFSLTQTNHSSIPVKSTTLPPTTTKTTTTKKTTTTMKHVSPSSEASLRPGAEGFSKVSFELMVAPPPVFVFALDLSQPAIDEVGVEVQRGALLRWMWGLPPHSRLSIIAAYNNDSFPLTLSPLPPTPRSSSQLEARLALLPLEDEATKGVYGGSYCVSCVLSQAAKMVKIGGAKVEGSVLIVASCRPSVGISELRQAEALGMSIHTVSLCPSTPYQFDQLASKHSSWVLPPYSRTNEGEKLLAKSLNTIVARDQIMPSETQLIEVSQKSRSVSKTSVQLSGAYSLVTGTLYLPYEKAKRFVLLSTSSSAKVVEIRDSNGRRLEVVRDTGKRFWLETSSSGRMVYTLKFLSTSLSFPLHISEEIYEQYPVFNRRLEQDDSNVLVGLFTSNERQVPLAPGSPPVIVWTEVTSLKGEPIVDAKVTLTVTHLSSGISSNFTLLDDGSTEPDVRSQDGVYTKYLTWRLGEGRYSLFATVETPVNVSSHTASKVSKSAARTLFVNRVSFEDTFPPSRVTDLTVSIADALSISAADGTQATALALVFNVSTADGVESHESENYVEHSEEVYDVNYPLVSLTWSAPGGDLDQGAASYYDVKMYTDRKSLTQDFFSHSGMKVSCVVKGRDTAVPLPGLYGTQQACLVAVPFTDQRWYFAMRAVDSTNKTGRVSNIVSVFVPTPITTTATAPAISLSSTTPTLSNHSAVPSSSMSFRRRMYIIAGVSALGLAMVIAAAVAFFCCLKRARKAKEKDPDKPVYKIYVNNAYLTEEDGEIKVVQEWVNSLDKYGNVEGAELSTVVGDGNNKTNLKYTSPVRFGVLTNGSIMRDATIGSTNSSSSRPSDDISAEEYKYRDLSESTSDSTDGFPPSSTSSAATEVFALPPTSSDFSTIPPVYPSPPHRTSIRNTNISSLPLPSPRKSSPHTHSLPLSIHREHISEDEGGFSQSTTTPPVLPKRQHPAPHYSSFRYPPPPPQYRNTQDLNTNGLPPLVPPKTEVPLVSALSRSSGTHSHGTVRSVKKRRHISFV